MNISKLNISKPLSFLFLSACLQSVPDKNKFSAPPQRLEEKLKTTVLGSSTENSVPTKIPAPFREDIYIDACPAGMSSIDNLFCIDKYEASVIDQETLEYASPHYIPARKGYRNPDWQFYTFSKMSISSKLLPGLIKEGQPLNMPVRGAEQYPNFKPLAVSIPGRIPVSYVNKPAAEQACANAGKRLCTRREWYRTCVGQDGPRPYFDEKGKEIFPESYPYGSKHQEGKCNIGLQNRWPPGILGRRNNGEMLDPRISALLGRDGLPAKKPTGSFPGCSNRYGVYDLVGNLHEIVADTHITDKFPRERATYVGSHYARSAAENCAEATTAHWEHYTDYSLGFRCCMNILH